MFWLRRSLVSHHVIIPLPLTFPQIFDFFVRGSIWLLCLPQGSYDAMWHLWMDFFHQTLTILRLLFFRKLHHLQLSLAPWLAVQLKDKWAVRLRQLVFTFWLGRDISSDFCNSNNIFDRINCKRLFRVMNIIYKTLKNKNDHFLMLISAFCISHSILFREVNI